MASVFSFLSNSDPWVQSSMLHSLSYSEVLYSGFLQTFKSGILESSKYKLTENALIELDTSDLPQKWHRIDWSLLEPFYEETPEKIIYGFRLGKEDFFTENSESLENWLFHLRSLCINSTFEEDFVIIKEIGGGSTCKVSLVQDSFTKSEYAAKCVKKEYLEIHKHALGNLIQEIKVLRKIDHHSIVSLYYVYETNDCIYLIMEYFPKGSLYKRVLEKEKFSEETCIKFTLNLLDALDYLHSKNIVHRDLKLENIMMTCDNDYDFKIIDFGLSYKNNDSRQATCGSPGYIAPEVLKKENYNSKIDIFSSGVILYILLTGEHPFNASNAQNILQKNKDGKFKEIKGKVSENAKEFVTKMMSFEPRHRPEVSELFDFKWLVLKRRGSICTMDSLIRDGSAIFDV